MPVPKLSVVIPTFNRLPSLARTLSGLARQTDVGPFEVVVVSDGSTDGTDEYLRSDRTPLPVIAVTQDNAGPAAARNAAIDAARGRLIVFIDDDTVPDPLLLAAHLRRHGTPDDDLAVMGPMWTPHDHRMSAWVAWDQAILDRHYVAMTTGALIPTAREFYTGNASVARRHIVGAGGFNTSFRRAEDVELAHRLADRGVRFAFEPNAIVLHYAERSVLSWYDVAYSYGCNDVRISREPGRQWLLDAIGKEFHRRHRLVRAATQLCLPRRRLAAVAPRLLTSVGRAAARLHVGSVSRPALSIAYNLNYYRGLADALGDPRQLLSHFTETDVAA
jgi:glycosyltransferase involved in cell wall biosynthesis